MQRLLLVLTATLSLLAPLPLAAENWPQWRGPNGDGTSPEKGLPVVWSKEKNVAWRFPLPGQAGSTPVVWGDAIFLTTADGEDLFLYSLSTAGKERWRRKLASDNKVVREGEGNSASSSPITDGTHVWAMVSTGDLACFDLDGKEIWRRNLASDYVPYDYWFVMGSTPLLAGEVLYAHCLQMKGSYIVALDKRTGRELWKRSRDTDAENESKHAYTSPLLYRDGDERLLLVHGGDYLTAHRLEDGEEVWRCGGLNPREKYSKFFRFIASPVVAPGIIIAPSAKEGPVFAVRPGGKGDVSKTHVLWSFPRTPDVATPAIHDGIVYLVRSNGVLIALDAKSGKAHYEERIQSAQHRASPVVADGKVYCAAKDGAVSVVRAGAGFELLATNHLDDPIAATPVVAGGTLYLRSFGALHAIRETAPAAAAPATGGR